MPLKTILIVHCFCFSLFAGCSLSLASLKYDGGGDWYANPSALPNLARAVRERTAIPICDSVVVTGIMDEKFFSYPFIYMTGHGDVHFSAPQRARLRTYLVSGGFLWVDDNYGMDKSFRSEMAALFPNNPLTEVPHSHPIFHSIYQFSGLPKIHEHDFAPALALGIFIENRLVVLYTFSSDIGDGMEDLTVHNDGPELHETALRMGINIVAWFFTP